MKKSKNTMKLLGITMYITNVDSSIIPNNKIYEIYSLRWQIEIMFKIWKSIFNISRSKPVKIERFKCQIYGKLILLTVSSSIIFKMRKELLENHKLEASEIKSAQIVKQHIRNIYLAVINRPYKVYKILNNIFNCIKKNGRKHVKKVKKTYLIFLERATTTGKKHVNSPHKTL
ncbi:MAG: transposase [Anaeromicrobium sp.]|nr:transposase [Anaeromicrobium sp.]MCT4594466.1 transposase [Anaeromicrobium sp.]